MGHYQIAKNTSFVMFVYRPARNISVPLMDRFIAALPANWLLGRQNALRSSHQGLQAAINSQ